MGSLLFPLPQAVALKRRAFKLRSSRFQLLHARLFLVVTDVSFFLPPAPLQSEESPTRRLLRVPNLASYRSP